MGMFGYSHYDYLDDHLDLFWQKVFGKTLKETWNAGIVSAHGDKGYSYKITWANVGINYYRGMMLFMLTYTKEIGDTPKHESDDWIINNYEKYLPLIEEVEKEIGIIDTISEDDWRG